MKLKVYKGYISEKEYRGINLTIIVTQEFGILAFDALGQEFINDGHKYKITIERIETEEESLPLSAIYLRRLQEEERKLVPA